MTAAQQLNLGSAVNLAASQAGLTTYLGSDGFAHPDISNADYTTQQTYLAALKAIIIAHPQDFDPATVTSAQAATETGTIENYSVGQQISDVLSGTANNALTEANTVGQGITSAVNFTAGALPVIVAVIIAILLFSFAKKRGIVRP